MTAKVVYKPRRLCTCASATTKRIPAICTDCCNDTAQLRMVGRRWGAGGRPAATERPTSSANGSTLPASPSASDDAPPGSAMGTGADAPGAAGPATKLLPYASTNYQYSNPHSGPLYLSSLGARLVGLGGRTISRLGGRVLGGLDAHMQGKTSSRTSKFSWEK